MTPLVMKRCLPILCLLFLFIFPIAGFAVHTITTFSSLTFCGTTYPTAYQNTVSFTLAEGSNSDFGSSQTNKTLILTLPTGFEFNTAVGPTVTKVGSRLTIDSAKWTTTAITVYLTTTATSGTQFNSITFNNFYIRATAAVSGDLMRLSPSVGTFLIETSVDKPGDGSPNAAESFGYMTTGSTTYVSSAVSQYSTASINRNCTASTNPILEIRVNVTGTSSCPATITQFNFNTTGDVGYSQNPTTNISKAKIYYSGQTQGFSYVGYFGSVSSPNGAFAINGSRPLNLGTGTYYFYLTYDVPATATMGEGLDASMTSLVMAATTYSDMSTPNPAGTRTITSATCAGGLDNPNPPSNLQTATVNSLVVPMDNSHQNLYGGLPFNLRAYGLVHALLMNDIPVKWIIKSGKAKDGIDFTATAARIYPTAVAAASQDFKASAFIIDSTWVNKSYYSGGLTATQVITAFEAETPLPLVAVYQLTSDVQVDVRYTLTARPKISIFSNGGYQAIHKAMLDTARIRNYIVENAGSFTGLSDCYTFCSESHWDYSTNPDVAPVQNVMDFVNQGGNFLAQCAGIDLYENHQPTGGHFQTTNGISFANTTTTNTYSNPDMAYNQYEGAVFPRSGTIGLYWPAASSEYTPEMYYGVSAPLATTNVVASAAHITDPDSVGSNVFYLGGHSYATTSLDNINGSRIYLNATLVPARRPTAFVLDPGSNVTICQGQSTTLGCTNCSNPPAPPANYVWLPTTGLDNPASSNPIASPTVTTTYTVTANNNGCLGGPNYVTVTVNPVPAEPTAAGATICSGSSATLTATAPGGTYAWYDASSGGTLLITNATYTTPALTTTTTYYVQTTSAGGCTSARTAVTVTVNSQPTTAAAGTDQTLCNVSTATLSGNTPAVGTGAWSVVTGTATITTSSSPTSGVSGLIVGASATLRWTISNGVCTPSSDDVVITIQSPPAVNAGVDQTVCANNANVTLNGSVAIATGGVWSSSGSGSFSPNNTTLNATYIPSAADKTAGTVNLTLTTTGNGVCPAVNDAMTVTTTSAPTANAGADQIVCANNANVTLNGSVIVATGGSWSTSGSGTFSPDSTNLNATYIPSAADKTAGTVTLTLATTGNGTCAAVSDAMIVTINPTPTADAGTDQTVCSDNANASLSGSVTVVVGGSWSTSGSGSFSPNNTTLNATYIPSVADKTAGMVTLTLTSDDPAGPCPAVNDAMVLTINPAATVNAGADAAICSGNTYTLSGSKGGEATSSAWTTSGTGTFDDATLVAATYTPSAADISATTVTLTLTTNDPAGPCPAINDAMVLAINPAATVNAGVDDTICTGNIYTLSGSRGGSASSSLWTTSGTGTFNDATSLTPVYTPSAADITAGSVTLTLITNDPTGPCPAVNDAMVLTITIPPTANAGTDQTVCDNNANVTLNGSVTVATGGSWATSGSGSFSPNNVTLNAVYVPSAADKASGSVMLTLTTTGNGNCIAANNAMTITITSAPTANAGADQTVCANNANVALSGSVTVATGGSWSTSGGGTFSPNNTTLNATYIPNAADKTAGTVTLTLTTTGNGTCTVVSDAMIVTITSAPTADAGIDQTVCANNANVTLNGSVTISTSGSWSTSGSGTFSPNNTTLNATYIPSAADKTAGTVTVTLISMGNGSCNAVSDAMMITITSAPTANAGANQTVCANNSNVTLNGSVTVATGGSWSTSGSGSFYPNNTTLNATYIPSAADKTAGTVTLTLTTSGNGTCTGVTDAMIVTITSSPTANASVDQTVCANNANVTLNGSVIVATGGAWSTSGSGTFSPNNATLNATYTPSAADKTVGTVTLTLATAGNGTCTAVSDAMTITITSPPTSNAGVDQTVCANNPNVTLNGSISVATGATWSTSATGSFSPNNATLNATYIPSNADTAAGSVTLTLTTTGNGSCVAVSDAMVVTITDAPHANAGVDQGICIGGNVTLSGSVTVATGGTWTGGGGTFTPNANTLNATYDPTPAEEAAGTVTLTLTTTSNGTCNAVSDNIAVTITGTITTNAGADQTVCANNANVSLNGSVSGGSTTGIWTTTGTGTFSPNANTLNAIYIPSTADKTVGSVTLILTSTNSGGCTPVSDAMVATITPAPTSNAGSDQTVCANNADVILNGIVTVATGGTWSTSGSGSFSPDNTTLNTTYIPSNADTAAGSVTLALTTSGNGDCIAVSDAMIITIADAPVANAGVDRTVCANNANVVLSGSVRIATGGSWSTSGSGYFSPNNTTLNATYTPSATDKTAGTVTLTLTTIGNGTCVAVNDAMTITITSPPTANAGADQTICANNANVSLSGSVTVATGGSWSTSGSGSFSPNNTTLNATYIPSATDKTAGTVTLTLTTTGNGTCMAVTDVIIITITPAPVVNAGVDQTGCASSPSAVLNGSVTIATGGAWSGGTGTFNPDNTTLNATYTPSASEISAGSVTLILTSTGNGNCIAVTDNIIITITSVPVVNAGIDKTVCANNSNVILSGTSSTGSGHWTSSGTGSFSPNSNTLGATYIPTASDKTVGTVTLTLASTNNGGCIAVNDTMLVAITPAPTANAGADQTVCANNENVTLNGSITVASGGSWSTSGSGFFSPNNIALNATYIPTSADTTAGSVMLTLTTTGNGNCIALSDSMQVIITDAPIVNAGNDHSVCINNPNVLLSGTSSTGSGLWSSSGSGTFVPNNTTLNATYIPGFTDLINGSVMLTLTSSNNGTCFAVSDSINITFTTVFTIDAGLDASVCANNSSVSLNGASGTGSGIWSTSGTGTFLPNVNTLNADYIPSNLDTALGIVTLTLATTNNGTCLLVTDQLVVTITPAPLANAGIDQSVCSNNADIALSGLVTVATGGFWSTSGSGSFSPDNITLNATYIPSNADTTAGSVILTLTTTGNGNCIAVSDPMAVNITDAPIANAGVDRTVCANNANVTLSGSVRITTGGLWSTSGSGSFSPNNTTLNATYIPSAADTTTGTVTLTLTTTGNGTCTAVNDAMVIIITPTPTADAGADQTICANNANVTLNGSVAIASGGSWSTSGSGSFSPNNTTLNATYIPSAADKTTGTVTLSLTTTGNGTCIAVNDAMIVTITPAPTANAGADQTVCANNANVTLNGSVAIATGGVWSSSGNGSFSPNNTTLNATYIPSAADKTAGTVTLTLTTTGNGTCTSVNDAMIVTITPAPAANAGADRNVCRNNANVTLSGSVTIANGGVWSTSGSGSFSPNNTTLNTTYIPSNADTAAGSVILILTTTGNGSCFAVSDTMAITISPPPSVYAGANQTVCANKASVSLNGISSTGAGIWITSGTGSFSPSNSTLNATYNPSSSDTTIGSVTLTLTSANNGGCNPITSQITITITDAPVANAGTDKSVCANNALVTLNGSYFSPATGGVWSTSGSGIFLPDSSSMNATYIPSSADTSAGIVRLYLATTGNGLCNPAIDSMTIIYTNAPNVNAGTDPNVCLGSPNYTLSGTSTTGSGTWVALGSGSFSPSNVILNATYIPSNADTATGTVTLVLTSANNGGCNSSSDTVVIIYTDLPTVNVGNNQTVCANNAAVPLSGTSSTGTGIWTTNGSGAFVPNSTTLNSTYNPSSADTTAGTVVLTFTSTNGCTPVSQSITITITDAPKANAGADRSVCKNNPNVALNGMISGGASTGKWSTNGSGIFSPDDSTLNATYIPDSIDIAAGSLIFTLTSTGNGTCNQVVDSVLITFTPIPVANAGTDIYICNGSMNAPLSGSVSGGSTTGVWTTTGTGTFSPNVNALNAIYNLSSDDTTLGTVALILTSTNNGNCLQVIDTVLINVTSPPATLAGNDISVCDNNANVQLNGAVISSTGTGKWSTNGSGIFIPGDSILNAIYQPSSADIAAGNTILILSATNACIPAPDSLTVTFTPEPVVDAGANIFICSGTMNANLSGSVSGGASIGRWTTSGTGTFFPNDSTLNATYYLSSADSTSGTIILVLTSSDNGNCLSVSDSALINITSVPITIAGNDTTVCANISNIQLNGSVIGASGTGQWITNGNGTFAPYDTTLNAIYQASSSDIASGMVTLVLKATNSCLNTTDTMIITFSPAPTSNSGNDQTICIGDSAHLNGSVTIAAGGHWTTSGTGTFVPNDTTLNATYAPSAGDISIGNVTLILNTTGNGICSAASDAMALSIVAAPVVLAGNDTAVCANSMSIQLNGSLTGNGIIHWTTTGSGTFVPNDATLNAIYQPSPADTASGSVTLILYAANACTNSSDTVAIALIHSPTSNAGIDQMVCAGDSVNLNGSVTIAVGGHWTTTGTGTFIPNDTTLSATYVPGAGDLTTGTVAINLTTTGNGNCSAASDAMIITITSAPLVFAGNDTSICANSSSMQLNGYLTGTGVCHWTTTGSGIFTPNNSTLNAMYQPSLADTVAGNVMLVLAATNACFNSRDTIIVTFTHTPIVNAGVDQIICSGDSVNLNGSITIANGGQWITSGTGAFVPNDSAVNATYIPSASDASAGQVVLILTAINACATVSDSMLISLLSGTSATAGPDQTICEGVNVYLNGAIINGTGGQWITSGDGSFIPNNTSLNGIYVPGSGDLLTRNVNIILTPTGSNNCGVSNDTLTVKFQSSPTSAFNFSFSCPDSAWFTDASTIASGNISAWTWNFGDLSSGNQQNPMHVYSSPGSYAVTLTVSSDSGCTSIFAYTVAIDPCSHQTFGTPAVPTAFTPNNDGHNDVLYVRGGPFKEIDFRVYNEWGNEVFRSEEQSSGWSGTFQGKLQPEGKYIWTLKGTSIKNDSVKLIGQVMLFR